MADYVRVNLGSPRTLHELVDLAFQVHKGHPLHGFAQVELKQQNMLNMHGDVSHPTITGFLRDIVQVREQVILFFLEQLRAQWARSCLPDRLVIE
jgi:hypothetical protein